MIHECYCQPSSSASSSGSSCLLRTGKLPPPSEREVNDDGLHGHHDDGLDADHQVNVEDGLDDDHDNNDEEKMKCVLFLSKQIRLWKIIDRIWRLVNSSPLSTKS